LIGLTALAAEEVQGQIDAVDLAEPPFCLGSGTAGLQVDFDLVQAREHVGVDVQDGAAQAGVLVLAAGSVGAGAVAELDFAAVEVFLEVVPFAAGDRPVFVGWALRAPPVQEALVVADDFVVEHGLWRSRERFRG
jgi:DNA mismatch repair protein MutH